MKFRITIALTSLFPFALCASAPGEEIITPGQLHQLGYDKYWQVDLEFDRGGFATAAYLRDDTLYVITDRGDVHALHAGVGLPRWSQNLTDSAHEVFPPSHFADRDGKALVVFSTSARTVIIDRYAGDVVADMPLDKATASPTIADAENIYFGSNDGHFYSMIWSDPRTNAAVFRWRVLAGGPVTSTPVLRNEGRNLIFASQAGSVFNCTSAFKVLNWKFTTEGPIIADIVVDDSGTYVASTDRSLYRLDSGSGVQRWRTRFNEPLNTPPVVSGRTIFQYARDEGMVALDTDTGQRLWTNPQGRAFICRNHAAACFARGPRELLKLETPHGKTRAEVKLSQPVIGVANTKDETLYLVSRRGTVLCAKPQGVKPLTPTDLAVAQNELRTQPRPPEAPTKPSGIGERAEDNGIIDLNDPLRSKSKLPPLGKSE